jgi:hypothetical protein
MAETTVRLSPLSATFTKIVGRGCRYCRCETAAPVGGQALLMREIRGGEHREAKSFISNVYKKSGGGAADAIPQISAVATSSKSRP